MKNIFIANKKSKLDNIKKKYPSAIILDITSTSEYRGLRILSPFFPHGNIPIPGMTDKKATCVEAIWQGLKVFEKCGVDYDIFSNDTMKNIKRSVRKYGKPVGHKYGDKILNYEDARWFIYLPTYLYVLNNVPSVQNTIHKIKERLHDTDIVFLDYNTNCNITDYSKPLSHAGLVKLYLENRYPKLNDREKLEWIWKNNVGCVDTERLIQSIKQHPKFNISKHGIYIEAMEVMDKPTIQKLLALNGIKRDGWKTIVKNVYNNKVINNQLSLFYV